MHMTFGVAVLATAVIIGPPFAWIFGEDTVSVGIALLAVAGRAVVGWINAKPLWGAEATPGLVLGTTLSAGLAGYTAVFLPLSLLGLPGGTELFAAAIAAALAFTLDCFFAIVTTCSGTLIAAAQPKRRKRPRFLKASKLPVVNEITQSFAEHRAQARLNVS